MRKLTLSVLACWLLLVAPLQAQFITYSETFTTGLSYCPGDPEYDNWVAFRKQLDTNLIAFVSVTIKGDLDPVGKTCTDPAMVMQMAGSLRDGVAGTWMCGAEEFNVGVSCFGGCAVAGDDVEFNATPASSCACSNPGYILRPCIGNQNWGGINGLSCSAPTQIMTVEFEYISYCTPTYTNKCSSGDYIDGVVFTDINNTGTGCNGNTDNYIYYPSMEANIAGGFSYQISLTPSSSSAQGFGVWMDYNSDDDFADAGEFVLAVAPGVVTIIDTINVPLAVTIGKSRMRVRSFGGLTPTAADSCSTGTDGETEDYVLMIRDLVDVGVTSIDAPLSGCGLTSTESITVSVRNDGLDVQDTIPLAYSVDGGPMVVDTMFTTLASGSTASFTFSATANLSANVTYTLDAWSMLAGDADMTNDSTMGYLVDNPLVCCIPTFSVLCTSGDFIDGVEFAGIINTGTGCNGNPDNYIFYSSPPASVTRGNTFPITLTPGSTFAQGFGVWIDFNIDGDFSDAGEFVFSSPANISAVTGSVAIPLTSSVGTTAMRVRCIYFAEPLASDDCSLATFGETEDYVIYISDPQPDDVGVIAINTPISGCGLEASEVINVDVKNFGLLSQDTFPVFYNIDGGAPLVDTIFATLAPGATTSLSFSATGDFSAPGTYVLEAWTGLSADTNNINDTIKNYQVVSVLASINSYPSLEDMETFTPGFPGTLANGWTNATGDDMDWTVNTGTTGSTGTGPNGDHTTGTGIYLYTEASGFSNMTAELLSPCIDLDSVCSPVLEVWYHMFGLTMGNLLVEVFDGANWIAIGGIAGPQQTQNADPWFLLEIPVPCSVGGIVQFKFIGQTGTSFTSDICIDDIAIREGDPTSAEFSADTASSCTGSAISFVDSNMACKSSWLWDFGDGNTDTSESPLHVYSDTGKYTVSLIVSNACGADTVTKPDYFNITVEGLVNANCIPSVLEVNNDVGIYDVTFNTISNPTGTLIEAYADYSCAYFTTVMSGSSQLLEVETGPVWKQSVRGWIDYDNDGIFDVSELVISTDDAVQTHSAQFIVPQGVVFDTILRMRIASDYFAFTAPGPCDTLGFGQVEDYGVMIIETALPPEATYSYESVDVCTGEVMFTDESTFFPTSWVWNFGDGVIDSSGPVVTHIYAPGTYNVSLIVTNQFGADTLSQTIDIDPIVAGITGPDTIYEGNTIQFESNSGGNGDTWLWDFGNTGGSTWENPTTTYVTPGTYTVILQVSNSVTSCMDSATFTIVVLGDTTGISTVSYVSHIAISPNPTHDRINIVFGNNYREEYQISITDFMGREIFEEVIQVHGVHTEVFDMLREASGVYFVRITNSADQLFVEKLILE